MTDLAGMFIGAGISFAALVFSVAWVEVVRIKNRRDDDED